MSDPLATDFAAFVASLEVDGHPLELAPFQREALDAMLADRWPTRAEMEIVARRSERSERLAQALAIAVLSGGRPLICTCSDEAAARRLLDRAAAIVDTVAETLKLDLPAPAAELVRITRRP